jgi:proteasome lid subunit RPN8/RPN11
VLRTRERFQSPGRLYYEVAANGLFQVRETETYTAVTRVTRDLPGLLPERERCALRFPPLPARLLAEVLAFFREVYERHGGEAVVLLFYHPERRELEAGAPPQTIAGWRDAGGRFRPFFRLDYECAPRPEGFLLLGTIHSHAGLPAYASAVDCDDERFEDGLHVVYGSFGTPRLSRSAAFVANGSRFHLRPEDVLEDCELPEGPARGDWLARVRVVEEPERRVTAAVWSAHEG